MYISLCRLITYLATRRDPEKPQWTVLDKNAPLEREAHDELAIHANLCGFHLANSRPGVGLPPITQPHCRHATREPAFHVRVVRQGEEDAVADPAQVD
jgi:hypothetical protein